MGAAADMLSGGAGGNAGWDKQTPPPKEGMLAEFYKGLKDNVGQDLASIPHLPDAVMNFGKDDGATEEVKALRRRAIALGATTLISAGLGTLAAGMTEGAAIPLIGPLIKFSTSQVGALMEGGATNILFNRLDAPPGATHQDAQDFFVGGALGGVLHGIGHNTALKRLFNRKGGVPGEEAMAALGEGKVPVPEPGAAIPPEMADQLSAVGGIPPPAVRPIPMEGRKAASAAMYTELKESHPKLYENRPAKLKFMSEVLGRDVPTTTLKEGDLSAADYRTIHAALRAKRGEGPLVAPAVGRPSLVTRISKTMAVGFPDAAHSELYALGRTGAVDEASATRLSAVLGIPPEEVAARASIYHSLTNLAAIAERGKGVLLKMPEYDEAIERMPEWTTSARENVFDGVTAARKPRAVSAGGQVVRRTAAKGASTFDPVGEQAVAASKGPGKGEPVGPPEATVSHMMVGKRKIVVSNVKGNIATLKYGGQTIKVQRDQLRNLIRDYTGHGTEPTGNVVKIVEHGGAEHKIGQSKLVKGAELDAEGNPIPKSPKQRSAIDKVKQSIQKAERMGNTARAMAGRARLLAMQKAEHVKVMNTVEQRLRVTLGEARKSGMELDPMAGRKIMDAFEQSKVQGDPSIFGRAIADMALPGKWGQTTAEALRKAGDEAGAKEFEARNALVNELHKRLRGWLEIKESGPVERAVLNPTKGQAPDLIEELFGKKATVAGAKPTLGQQPVQPVKFVRGPGGQGRYVTVKKPTYTGEQIAGRNIRTVEETDIMRTRKRITYLENQLTGGKVAPGDRESALATINRLYDKIERLKGPGAPTAVTAQTAAAQRRNILARGRIQAEAERSNPSYSRGQYPEAPAGARPKLMVQEGDVPEISELQDKIDVLEKKGAAMSRGEMASVARMKKTQDQLAEQIPRPAVKLRDGTVVVDNTHDVRDVREWKKAMAQEVQTHEIVKEGVVQNGKFYGRALEGGEITSDMPTSNIPTYLKEEMRTRSISTNRILNDIETEQYSDLLKKDPFIAQLEKLNPELAQRARSGNVTRQEMIEALHKIQDESFYYGPETLQGAEAFDPTSGEAAPPPQIKKVPKYGKELPKKNLREEYLKRMVRSSDPDRAAVAKMQLDAEFPGSK